MCDLGSKFDSVTKFVAPALRGAAAGAAAAPPPSAAVPASGFGGGLVNFFRGFGASEAAKTQRQLLEEERQRQEQQQRFARSQEERNQAAEERASEKFKLEKGLLEGQQEFLKSGVSDTIALLGDLTPEEQAQINVARAAGKLDTLNQAIGQIRTQRTITQRQEAGAARREKVNQQEMITLSPQLAEQLLVPEQAGKPVKLGTLAALMRARGITQGTVTTAEGVFERDELTGEMVRLGTPSAIATFNAAQFGTGAGGGGLPLAQSQLAQQIAEQVLTGQREITQLNDLPRGTRMEVERIVAQSPFLIVDNKTRDTLSDLDKAEGIVKIMQQEFNRLGNKAGSSQYFTGLLREFLASAQADPDVQLVLSQRGLLGNLARSVGSERGVLTDKDLERAGQLLANPRTRQDVADKLFKQLDAFIDVGRNAALNKKRKKFGEPSTEGLSDASKRLLEKYTKP